jgi:predicted ester cyclase
MPEVKDLAGVKQFYAMANSASPDIQFTIEDIVAEGDKVVYRYTARATHKGDFMGIGASGKQVTVNGTVISPVVNDNF